MEKPWVQFYERGVPEDISYPAGMLVHQLEELVATRFASRPAILFPRITRGGLREGRLSYRELDASANRFANGLAAMGVAPGDRVAIVMPNSPQFAIAALGTFKAGAVIAASGSNLGEAESWLVDCGAETVVTEFGSYPVVKGIQPKTRVTRIIATSIRDYLHPLARASVRLGRNEISEKQLDRRDYSFRLILKGSPEVAPDAARRVDDPALIYYSHVDTGASAGVALTHRNLVAGCLQMSAWWTGIEPGNEVGLVLTPLSEPFGFQCAFLNPLTAGAALALFPRLEPPELALAVDKYGPTFLAGSPSIFDSFLQAASVARVDLSSLRFGLCAGGLITPDGGQDFEARTGGRLVQGLGVLEGGALTHLNPIHGPYKPGSIGVPLPGTLARIVDPEFPEVELPAGRVGELLVKGPQVPVGYWDRRTGRVREFEEEWRSTGQWARADVDGFFYTQVDRLLNTDEREAAHLPAEEKGEGT